MRIDRLVIENFRCFDRLEMELHPRLHVLVGVNGSGKTALKKLERKDSSFSHRIAVRPPS
jgi:recombinational DNA repair ATPase RecF